MNTQQRFDSITMNSVFRDICLSTRTSNPTPYGAEVWRKIPLKTLPEHLSQSDKISTPAEDKLAPSKANKQDDRSKRIANGIKEHVKGNLRLGAKLLRAWSTKKIFKQIFGVIEEKLAFRSDRSIVKVSSPTGELLRFHYKVVIPLRKIEKATKSKNTEKRSKQYLHLITTDEFEFWFMGFLKHV